MREARARQKKKLRGMELARTVGPDELRRAERELDRANDRALKEVKGVEEAGRRALAA